MLRGVWTVLLAISLPGFASAAGEQLELVSRVHPGQVSDTGAGARPTFSYFAEEVPRPPSISADGRYVVFLSSGSNLIPGQSDLNAQADVFLRDLVTGTTTLVSRAMSSPTKAGNGGSNEAVISAGGRYVAFVSSATDLVPEQGSSFFGYDQDLLVYDTVTGSTTLAVSTRDVGEGFSDLAISTDGRFIVFVSGANDLVPGQQGDVYVNVFLYDRLEKSVTLVSHTGTSAPTTTGGGNHPALSADGRYAVFTRRGPDFVPGILIYDRVSGSLSPVGEGERALISADGRHVAVSGIGVVYLYNRETMETTPLSEVGSGPLAINADGRFVVFARAEGSGSGDAVPALTLYDRISRTFTRMTPPSAGQTVYNSETGISPGISADGRYTVFTSRDPKMVPGQTDTFDSWDVFRFDRTSGTVALVSHASSSPSAAGNSFSYSPAISANGARIVFDSTANNLIEGLKDLNEGHDVFVHEVASGSNAVISQSAASLPSLSSSFESQVSALSADGRFVAFESKSPRLVSGQVDSNGMTDVFLYDRSAQTVTLVSHTRTSASKAGNGQSVQPVLSADGRYVAFVSNATDIVPGGNDASYKVFLFDRITGTTALVGRTGQPAGPEYTGWNVEQRISQDGRWVVFTSLAPDLIAGQQEQSPPDDPPTLDLFLWDRVSGNTILASRTAAGATVTAQGNSYLKGFSADGRYVLFNNAAGNLTPGQIEPNEGSLDAFLFDRVTGKTALLSHARGSATTAASGVGLDMSADGRFIVFTSDAEGLDPGAPPGAEESIYVYDRTSATAEWVAEVDVFIRPRISGDGRYVVFNNLRSLVPGIHTGGEHIFLYDRVSKAMALVTHPAIPTGGGSVGNPGSATISSDGRYIAFASDASDLVDGLVSAPMRDEYDVFLFDRVANTTVLVNRLNGSPITAPGNAFNPLLSASGRQVAFTSNVDLVSGDFNLRPDAYVFSLDPPPPVPLTPCTLLDTRRRADRPALASNVQRTVAVRGACGVPATAKQVVVKVTVFNPTGKGNLRLYPGAVTATPAGLLRFERNATRTETFTLPLSVNGTLTILPFIAGKGTVHVAVEVNGYSQ